MPPVAPPLVLHEFFAGGGMARAGVGAGWACGFANDLDPRKGAAYRANWGGEHLTIGDVGALTLADVPRAPGSKGAADLAWASSPCQDLSLAGRRAGLAGARSGAFWSWWRLIQALGREGRAPGAVVIENVAGLLTSHGGTDFTAVCAALDAEGYRFGALEIDAAHWLPQSRPRLFLIAAGAAPEPALTTPQPSGPFHTARVAAAVGRLPEGLRERAVWWRLDAPPARNTSLADLLEPDDAVRWHGEAQAARLLSQLSPLHRTRLEAAVARTAGGGGRGVGAAYRRVRMEAGARVQRAEVRFDGLAGCLRTPGGGSSRQFVLVVEGGRVRTRPLTPREGARLMGLPDSYVLPSGETAALKLVGDGVAVPVVRWLTERLLEPLLRAEGRAINAGSPFPSTSEGQGGARAPSVHPPPFTGEVARRAFAL